MISEAPKRAWQLPPGTEWPKVTISFVAEAVINVKLRQGSLDASSPNNSV